MGSQVAKHEGGDIRTGWTKSGPAYRAAAEPPGGVKGIDVSRWQGEVDWAYWWGQGKRFAYVKATEGTTYVSPTYSAQYSGAAQVGMLRGAYHFALPDVSTGAVQADYFVDNGGGWTPDGKTLPGVLDIEYNPYGAACYDKSPAEMVAWIKDFSDTVRKRTGRYPVIYTTTNWWKTCTGNSPLFGTTNPLWIARYSDEVGELPAGWSKYTFWQYSTTPLDLDHFPGYYSQLKAMATNSACMPRCRDR